MHISIFWGQQIGTILKQLHNNLQNTEIPHSVDCGLGTNSSRQHGKKCLTKENANAGGVLSTEWRGKLASVH